MPSSSSWTISPASLSPPNGSPASQAARQPNNAGQAGRQQRLILLIWPNSLLRRRRWRLIITSHCEGHKSGQRTRLDGGGCTSAPQSPATKMDSRETCECQVGEEEERPSCACLPGVSKKGDWKGWDAASCLLAFFCFLSASLLACLPPSFSLSLQPAPRGEKSGPVSLSRLGSRLAANQNARGGGGGAKDEGGRRQ